MRRIALVLGASLLLASCVSPAERQARLDADMAYERNIESIRQSCERMDPQSATYFLCLTVYNNVLQERAARQARADQQRAEAYRALGDGLKDFGKTAFQPVPIQQNRQLHCSSQAFGEIVHTNCY